MTSLVVRRLLIDLETPFARHWCGGDAFRTAMFNAMSMSFPVGEQFFIDSVRKGFLALPADRQQEFKSEMEGFVGQEATHRRIHALFNMHLEQRGLVNGWAARAQRRLERMDGKDVRHWLAVTAANEHFTAILADWMLRNQAWLDGSEARLKTLWLWHSAEESEHKSTAFDLYCALDGNDKWRITWFRHTTLVFIGDLLRQTINNLHRDGTLWQWRTWKSAAVYLFGRRGLVRQTFKPWRQYLKRDFHPSHLESGLAASWLTDNAETYTPVRRAQNP